MRRLLILICIVFYGLNLYGQNVKEKISRDVIEEHIVNQLDLFPQEKLHLHIDRDYYVPGDKIWFKAYPVEATSHQYFGNSRYIYVELVAPVDTLVSRQMIRLQDNGLYYGHIYLSEVLPAGTYTICAYSKYMDNPDRDYFFKRPIQIGALSIAENQEQKTSKKKTKKVVEKEDYDVSFFPEGGQLLSGAFCRVAFKAMNSKGYSEDVVGKLVDEAGEELLSVKTYHAGMGMIAFIPEKGKAYYLNTINEKGQEKRFILPDISSETYSLQASWRRGVLVINRLESGKRKGSDKTYLLIHNRGKVLYFSAWDNSRKYLSFAEDQLPSGVIQVLLFDENMNPLSERLVFSKNKDQAKISFQTDKEMYKQRDKVSISLKVTDMNERVQSGNLSVAVTDDNDIEVNDHYSILTSLLLSSDLRGYIESPGYYFQDTDRSTAALDLLMMTHGWRRYNIPEVIHGNYKEPENRVELTESISGTVTRLISSKPVPNGEITLMAMSDGSVLQTTTDEEGRFSFDGIEFPDSTHFFIQSLNQKGGNRVELSVDSEKYPVVKGIGVAPERTVWKEEGVIKNFMEKAEERIKYNEEMRIIHLEGVSVVASKMEKEKARSIYSAGADASVTREEIERRQPQHVYQLLYGLSGVRVVSDNVIQIRGSKGQPLIVIDDIILPDTRSETDQYMPDMRLNMVNVNEVERIDVFKGPSAAIFGMRGGNGVISITTRKGTGPIFDRETYNQTALLPLGYQQPIEFYSPKYDTLELRTGTIPDLRTTVFWKPDLIATEDGEASFDFYTSDYGTSYSVVIEGITEDGKIIRSIEKITLE